MKRFLFVLTLLLSIPSLTQSQSLDTGVQLYEDGNYERALRIFQQSDLPTAKLFAGKSYFALNNFLKAKHFLNQVDSSDSDVYTEAKYTLALTDLQLKNFTATMDALFELRQNSRVPDISQKSYELYRTLLDYLELNQRHEVFIHTSYDRVRKDLVESMMGKVELGTARAFYDAYKRSLVQPDSSQFSYMEDLLSDTAAYAQRYNPNRYAPAPTGLTYNIGVALPEFDIEAPQYEISQHLYLGIQLAVENFNSANTDQKAFITYQNTQSDPAKASDITNNLVWNHSVDAIIGPLFSEVAVEMSKYAEMYEIPMLTPLANSDSLNLDLSYTYQLNPTFAIQGKTIARYATQVLEFDTLAVIADRGSLGEPSAVAFLDEVRRQGAEVVRYYVEDLGSDGYDINQYVKYFDPEVDTVFNYNIDAVYAPFTGNIAQTLISSLLTNLEAMESTMSILGSEEWASADLNSRRLPETKIYYTSTFQQDSTNMELQRFESAFRLRFNTDPNRFALIGYDAANVLLNTLTRVKNPAKLKEGLKSFNNYRGLITNVSFKGTHINQEVKIESIE